MIFIVVFKQGLVRKRFIPFIVNRNHNIEDSLTTFNHLDKHLRTKYLQGLENGNSSNFQTGDEVFMNTSINAELLPVGKVISLDASCSVGIAMIRLESISQPTNDSDSDIDTMTAVNTSYCIQGKSSSNESITVPIQIFKPVWWTDNDPVTGKKILE